MAGGLDWDRSLQNYVDRFASIRYTYASITHTRAMISMTSRAKEDYLKAIYELEEKVGVAKTTQLAERLGVRAATVTEMVQRLSKEPDRTITYKHHQGVRLTHTGRQKAIEMVRRHRLLETFLHQTLGLSWDEVHQEAEVLEHHLSERVTEAIDRHLDFPKFDPHGEPIPDADGNMAVMPQLVLSDIDTGSRFMIIRVDPVSSEFLAYLDDLAMGIGTTGRLLSKDEDHGPLSIELDDRDNAPRKTLKRQIADRLYVEAL